MEKDTTKIAIDYLRLEYENYWLKNEEQIKITIDTTKINLVDFNLSGPGNTSLRLDGFYDVKQNDAHMDIDQ